MRYLCKVGAKKKYLTILLVCLLLLGCSNSQTFTYQKVNSEEALEIMHNTDNYIIIDVRTREEFAEGHVENAFNIPYDEINDLIDIDKDTILFVYCKSGTRSKLAADSLINLGYEVYDLGAYDTIHLEE